MAFVLPARHPLRAGDPADARYAEPLGVDDMARAAGLSRGHLSREFRRAFGESPHAFLLTRRPDRPVTDICLCVALQSLGSFTTSFTRTYGMSPAGPSRRLPSRNEPARRPAPPVSTAARDTARLEKNRLRPPAWHRPRPLSRTGRHPDDPHRHRAALVHDREETLAFHTRKVGMEVRADLTLPELGGFGGLTVAPRGRRTSRPC